MSVGQEFGYGFTGGSGLGGGLLRSQSKCQLGPCLVRLSRLEHRPINPKAVGLIPGQGTCLVCRFRPPSRAHMKATNQCFSLTSMFSSPPLFLPSWPPTISMSLGEGKKSHLGLPSSQGLTGAGGPACEKAHPILAGLL